MTGLYLYQTVHLARGRARNVAGHIAVLDAASRALFGRPYAPAAERLAKRIETLSAAERYPAGVSGFVRIELDPDGTERLLPAGVSLYDGYAFRSLQPEAVTVGYDLTLSEAPTSAREAAAQLARRLAERIAAELRIPTYCYEAAAFVPERKNLAVCRAGEYEALPEKLAHKETAPDFGAREKCQPPHSLSSQKKKAVLLKNSRPAFSLDV